MSSLEIPLLRQGEVLIASIQVSLKDQDLVDLQNRLAREAGRRKTTGVVIDVTVVDVIDSFSIRLLRSIAEVLKLRGVRTIVVGVQPEVAIAMVRLGLAFGSIETALDLDDGLAALTALPPASDTRQDLWHSRNLQRPTKTF